MYEAAAVEEKWRKYWKEKKLFRFDDKNERSQWFLIDTPPPFTNGALHMGQVFWVCYIDAIARYKRMKGFNVLYPQGWDAHGFPTEREVEKKYGKGLPRQEFYKRCIEVSRVNIDTMRNSMLKLGATFDDRYDYLTISDDYLAKVQKSVLDMYEKGLVYRAAHPVEWCVNCGTVISREQAEEREEESVLNYLDFSIVAPKGKKAKEGSVTIATSRPELLHACVAVAVNPKDKRFKDVIGQKARVPIFGQEVPVIADDAVDKDYGTGAEMVCTFGDKRDINLYYKHKLRLIEATDEKGFLKNAGPFNKVHLRDARGAVLDELKKTGQLKKQEPMKHVIKIHDRCSNPIEFISSMQWFMKTTEHAEKIKQMAQGIKWVPEFTKQRLIDWANFIEWDWAISRNRVFGTPIPFWYCDNEKCGNIVPADSKKLPVDPPSQPAPLKECPKCRKGRLIGETLTMDGWVDTSITPMVIAGWPEDKARFKSGFPNAIRIQGTDIIRTWCFYTIYRTWALTGNKPWEGIIAHGMILGLDGREMHKSYGNGMYSDELTQKYPVDAIRLWVALSGGITKDKPFSYQDMEFAKSFVNKFYNTANFVKLALSNGKLPKEEPHKSLNVFDMWILNRLDAVVKEVTANYDSYMLYEALISAVNFYWHEFADFYIENVKHRVYSEDKKMQKSKEAALFTLNHVLNTMTKVLAPVVPFVCEEVNSMFDQKHSVFEGGFPSYSENKDEMDYVINGVVFKSSIVNTNPENAGIVLNNAIAEVRKQKAQAKIALNKEIASININVPDEYYSTVLTQKEEIALICKARKVSVSRSKEFSVSIQI